MQVVVAAPGPSLKDFVFSERSGKLPLIGCGSVPTYIHCDYWTINDESNIRNIPSPPTVIYAHPRMFIPTARYIDPNIPYGGTSGGLAVMVAADILGYTEIGLVGFDGHGLPNNFKSSFDKDIIGRLTAKGVRLYSLMKDSIFNKGLECLNV